MLSQEWINGLDKNAARLNFHQEVAKWANRISETSLTTELKMDYWDRSIQVAAGGKEYSYLINFLFRTRYNLYCLVHHRKTIEELSIGAYVYAGKAIILNKEIEKAALADFRKLMRLSNTFLLAEWVHDMIDRAISNNDETFFVILSNALKKNIILDSSQSSIQWLLVLLLWYMGGKDYPIRREFIIDLKKNDILPNSIDEQTFNTEISRLGLTIS